MSHHRPPARPSRGPWAPGGRARADEHSLILFARMLSRNPVWVDSPMGQRAFIELIGLDGDGNVVAFDEDGNDRRAEEYLLDNPHRPESGA